MDDLMDQIGEEIMQAFQKKDKAMLIDAFRALILQFEQEDQNPDEEMST